MKLSSFTTLAVALPTGLSQAITCMTGFSAGRDEVIFTVPYTYTEVLSIIGSYQNLTWSGSPEGSVTLDGPDNTVGTTRTYELAGAHLVETLTTYEKPATNGPYVEVHTLALLIVPAANVSFSAPFDGTTVTEICGGKASTFNLTTLFCADNVTVAGQLVHQLHITNAQTVGVFLGGQNFSSCAALSGGNATNTTIPSTTATSTLTTFTGGAVRFGAAGSMAVGFVAAVLLL